jgi:hypothetical protein
VSCFLEACHGVGLPRYNSEDAAPKFIPSRSPPFLRAVLFAFVFVLLLLLALFGNWLVGSVCDEPRLATPFQGPFSSVCQQIAPRGLLLREATGYAI